MADTVTLSPDLAFFPLDDDLVAFSEQAQSLVGLNTTAAFLVRKLQEGTPVSDLTDVLAREFAVTAEQAEGWVASTLEALRFHKGYWLGRSPSCTPFSAKTLRRSVIANAARQKCRRMNRSCPRLSRGRYRLLGTHALIRYRAQANRSEWWMPSLGTSHQWSDETPNLVIDISATPWGDKQISSNIYCDGKPGRQRRKNSVPLGRW